MRAQTDNIEHVCFVCPACGTVQCGEDLVKAGAGKDFDAVRNVLGFSCVGRYTHSKQPPKTKGTQDGCNWTLGGLFQIHEFEVVTDDGKKHPHFRLATKDEYAEHFNEANQ